MVEGKVKFVVGYGLLYRVFHIDYVIIKDMIQRSRIRKNAIAIRKQLFSP